MENVVFMGVLSWLVPGLGHLLLRRWLEGSLLFAGFIILLISGILLGGLYYPGNPAEFGFMYWLHQLACYGSGVYILVSQILKENLQSAAALESFRSASFEYGGRCLALAGLINYLAVLDVVDIKLRRKP